mmetsp:Transcript_11668/g.14077  ORF Transcript_11668/g.14077 Transcript_11668/m.14077 type:complete len:738 (-) Transcript_11668:99-2312(-)|eukprot:CAMPEP_0114336758 /NCGR_PEP_ID=MMETSP0101-20121206/5924_1 /TAXON_ID=38822 ORGANISM="Pteridomonas danica, Strain PT" /NCGR_SAMPLE_ID=MMETSP0101 /ASSEMBLY_ACC=CAM_ASM_000211 /LENGTH=737 /DNA_ID=CAMNT_0001468795 /DNA_START=105 /DNA_END=2318 /DNA_ORIENTATION=-
MGRGKPKMGEQRSGLAKQLQTKKNTSRNGGSAASSHVELQPQRNIENQAQANLLGDSKSLNSIMEMASVDEFLVHAKLTKRDFEARRGWFDDSADNKLIIADTSASAEPMNKPYEWHALPMPERPQWSHTDTVEELEHRENLVFVEWRRRIALTEEAVLESQESVMSKNGAEVRTTPFEKNLEVWRQLWRVVERSDVLVQVVDSRQPLFYHSDELHQYSRNHYRVKPPRQGCELTQVSANYVERLLILNKGDFLTTEQRNAWGAYMRSKGLRYVWFSAKEEQERLNEEERVARDEEDLVSAAAAEKTSDEEPDEQETPEEQSADINNEVDKRAEELAVMDLKQKGPLGANNDSRLLTREELLRVLEDLCREADANRQHEPFYAKSQVGIVGYPNVGKSSVINVLIGATPLNHQSKRVATGATPGKTKHFQTIELPPLPSLSEDRPETQMTLCDCPGLVFPQFVSSSADMLHAGVLNVTQLRDHIPPMRLLCERIPRAIIEATYGFVAPKVGSEGLDSAGGELAALQQASEAAAKAAGPEEVQLSEFLTVEATLVGIGHARSWFAAGNRGEVDRSRVARMLLTDTQKGKLLYALPPPDITHGSIEYSNFILSSHRARYADLLKRKKMPNLLVRTYEVPSMTSATSAEDAWMDDELNSELRGDGAEKGHTRLRAKKAGRLERKQMKGKKLKGKKKHGADPYGEDGGGAHVSGNHVVTQTARPVLPHHPTYQQAIADANE